MMLRELGERSFRIWLLGESNPRNWEHKLDTPFDPRHPARHNVWTSVVDVVQDLVFRERRTRVDTSRLYIRNAIKKSSDKPRSRDATWPEDVCRQVNEFRSIAMQNRPSIVFSFGAFAFEFARRAVGEKDAPYGHWGAKTLGDVSGHNLQPSDLGL